MRRVLKMNKKQLLKLMAFPVFVFFIMCIVVLSDSKVYQAKVTDKASIMPYDDYTYMTTDDLTARVDDLNIFVPRFFRTDLATIPRPFWIFNAPYKANFVYPAIIHDYLYSCPNGLGRKEIDDIFLSLLLSEKTSYYNAYKMYLAVRLFGGTHFFEDEICDETISVELEQDESIFEGSNRD